MKNGPAKNGTVALDRALSKLGILSRSIAREFIKNGRVKINGKIIQNPEIKIVPENIKVMIDDVTVGKAQNLIIAYHKPKGEVTTTADEKNRPTVFDHLPKEWGKLVSVGRLDMATTGLLLLTTNTRLANYLTDPENKIEREYVALVRGEFTEAEKDICKKGILDQDEILKAKEIEILKSSKRESQIKIILTQGRNREIRRMMEHLQHEILKLKRISFGTIALDNLQPGEWRKVSLTIPEIS